MQILESPADRYFYSFGVHHRLVAASGCLAFYATRDDRQRLVFYRIMLCKGRRSRTLAKRWAATARSHADWLEAIRDFHGLTFGRKQAWFYPQESARFPTLSQLLDFTPPTAHWVEFGKETL